jgi:hypothetical protein
MKTKREHEVIARIARGSLTLAAVLALVIFGAGIGGAQTQSRATQATTPKPTAEPGAAAGQSAAKGQHEGITVHGHWTIEVKNPDGTVVTHREFENSLNGATGSNLLAGILSGVYTPGPWLINLLNGSAPSPPGPCSRGPNQGCLIVSANATAEVSEFNCSTSLASASPQPFCFATLVESLPTPGSFGEFNTFTLAGSAYADTSSTINEVTTNQEVCPNSAYPGPPGTAVTPDTVSPSACLATGESPALSAFTAALLSSGVPVNAGQTIAVTVVLSFQ